MNPAPLPISAREAIICKHHDTVSAGERSIVSDRSTPLAPQEAAPSHTRKRAKPRERAQPLQASSAAPHTPHARIGFKESLVHGTPRAPPHRRAFSQCADEAHGDRSRYGGDEGLEVVAHVVVYSRDLNGQEDASDRSLEG